ncbi:protein indeterminate-domain 4, chloroplastic-like [Zingiber officinale]|uniref:protein indeterminate-domain 4, chloroplastic-like n=1 Tax=Zingiber officinale TaxID=94328 RepID=UPI001C4CA298|nr:protein indeterminate-domain 4, chloroplastic-like [Zingiber officinale]
MASASSSSPFHGIRDREEHLQNRMKTTTTTPPNHELQQQSSSSAAPAKKRRSQPGNPNPDAEVIALSPTTLMATNRFVCEVCNKGFQREQNLQLHRRGHNLPWKLKLKSSKEPPRRKVYLCPEPSCVHHDPARALGDLTGIKKHFCRKHGEKKWKCDKCAKRYAVHSDLKAHAKTCGTREYRCDCGTLFSRRDSFITHRAFCDALAQESTRLPAAGCVGGSAALGNHHHLYGSSMMHAPVNLSQVASQQLSSLRDQSNDASQFHQQLVNPLSGSPAQFRSTTPTANFYLGNGGVQDFNVEEQSSLLQRKPFHGLMQLPDLQGHASSSNFFNLGFFSNNNAVDGGGGGGADPTSFFSGNLIVDGQMASPSLYDTESSSSVHPRMSATSLLQRAAQMGSTTSAGPGGGGSLLLAGFGNPKPPPPSFGGGLDAFHTDMDNVASFQNIMNAFANGGAAGPGLFSSVAGFGEGAPRHDPRELTSFVSTGLDDPVDTKFNLAGSGLGGSDHLTRDFLGVGGIARSIGGGAAATMSLREQVHGMDVSMLDPK